MRDHLPAPEEAIDGSRRLLLKAGLLGPALLGAGSVAAGLSGCTGRKEAVTAGYKFLRDADLVLFRALIAGGLGPMLQTGDGREAQVSELLRRIDVSGYRLAPPAQNTLAQLFDLLNLRVTRWLLARIGSWETASGEEVDAFLYRWRNSRVAVLNAGYRVIVNLLSIAYYGSHAGWAAANYPGPPPGPISVFNS
jgi:hypothetical protein